MPAPNLRRICVTNEKDGGKERIRNEREFLVSASGQLGQENNKFEPGTDRQIENLGTDQIKMSLSKSYTKSVVDGSSTLKSDETGQNICVQIQKN